MGKIDNLFAASRFVLPEHRETYLELRGDEKLIPQPILEEDELRELAFQIQESIQFDAAVTIEWWKATKGKLGICESAWGWVQKVDAANRHLKLVNDEDFWWIPLDKIASVKQQ
ncbi:MAG TPA: YolD-like family protein [Metabacillus sp.]|nr:YolD-like family protein [Metabacillus sp.]